MADIATTEPKTADAGPTQQASGRAWRIFERLLSLTILLLITWSIGRGRPHS